MRKIALGCGLIVSSAMLGHAAAAQSADQILNALRPTAQSLHGATRGIRPLAASADTTSPIATPAAGPRAKGVQQAAASQAQAAPSVDMLIEFRSGSAELTPAAAHALDELGKALSNAQLAGDTFRIEGHTDTVGTPEANKALSDQRARTVTDYLVGRFGVAAARLQPVGLGMDDLAVATGPQVPEARNRRVRIINLGA